MSFWKPIAKAAVTAALESFATAAGSHIADRLLKPREEEDKPKDPDGDDSPKA